MHCLVVDPNLAFATLLSEELVRLGYEVTTCTSALEAYAAVQAAASSPPEQSASPGLELALLDMALRDPDALALGHELRAVLPSLRLVLIPMMGEEPVLGDDAPAIQGVLPKPFFLPELPQRIEAALTAPLPIAGFPLPTAAPSFDLGAQVEEVGEPVSETLELDLASLDWASVLAEVSEDDGNGGGPGVAEEPDLGEQEDVAALEVTAVSAFDSVPDAASARQPEPAVVSAAAEAVAARAPALRGISRRALRINQERVMHVMHELVNELGADAVLLTTDAGVLAWAGSLEEDNVQSISGAVLESRRASESVARTLGREQVLFEQSLSGGSYLLYAVNVHDAILAVTVSGQAPLGLLRHRTRSAGERITELCTLG